MRAPLTVVVPCRDRAALLGDCLRALRADLRPDDTVIVVDSASSGGAVAAVAREAGASLVRCDSPGTSRARNAGWRAAETSYVGFVDDDVRVEPGWADALVAALDGDPSVGFAAGRLIAAAPGVTSTVTSVEPPALVTDVAAGVFSAGNLVVPAAVLREVGGFDERLGPATWFAAGEDVELLDRVIGTGRTGRYVAAAVGRHAQWRDAGALRRLHWAYGKGYGAWVAARARRDGARAVRPLLPELLRLRGVRTALSPAPIMANSAESGAETAEFAMIGEGKRGLLAPIAWRAGAVSGFAVGLARLGRRR